MVTWRELIPDNANKNFTKGGFFMELTQLRFRRMAIDRSGAKNLAQRIGMNPAELCAVERGDKKCPPKWHTVLSEALGVPVGKLFDKRGMALLVPEGNNHE
jgi:hypothetical protein